MKRTEQRNKVIRAVELKTQERNGDGKAFDLRGLLAQCVQGNANWLDKINGYVRTSVAAKLLKGDFTCPMPLSER